MYVITINNINKEDLMENSEIKNFLLKRTYVCGYTDDQIEKIKLDDMEELINIYNRGIKNNLRNNYVYDIDKLRIYEIDLICLDYATSLNDYFIIKVASLPLFNLFNHHGYYENEKFNPLIKNRRVEKCIYVKVNKGNELYTYLDYTISNNNFKVFFFKFIKTHNNITMLLLNYL